MSHCGLCRAQQATAQKKVESGDRAGLQAQFEQMLRQARPAATTPPPAQAHQTIVVRGPNSAVIVETAPPKP